MKSVICQTANSTLSVRTSKEPELKGLKTTLWWLDIKNTRMAQNYKDAQIKFNLRVYVCCALPVHF